MDTLLNIVTIVGGLVGFGVLVSAVVGLGKSVGLINDGSAGHWITGANLLAVVAVFVAQVGGFDYDLKQIDQVLKLAGDALVSFTQLFIALGGSKIFYRLTKGRIPVIGKTFSAV